MSRISVRTFFIFSSKKTYQNMNGSLFNINRTLPFKKRSTIYRESRLCDFHYVNINCANNIKTEDILLSKDMMATNPHDCKTSHRNST